MDSIFKALADPSRRALLDALRRHDGQTLTELEAAQPMSRFGVAKHLRALEAAGLVTRVKRGRFIHHYLNAVSLAEALGRWIEPYKVAPAVGAMLGLKARLEREMKPDFVLRTYIRCSQDALWEALTDPGRIPDYYYMIASARRNGDAIVMDGANGTPMLVCTETEVTPKTRIASTFEPKYAPDARNSRFVYEIEPEGESCRLTLSHYDIPPGADMIGPTWERIISALKTLLETGQPKSFAA